MADTYKGQMDIGTDTTEFNVLAFLMEQRLGSLWTMLPAEVMAVRGGGLSSPATVDIRPYPHQIDGYKNATPHGTIHGAPCIRLQAGSTAIILDPLVGDIGVALFAQRDISSVVANKGAANPGSFRVFDPADAIYLGSILGGEATRYIWAAQDGITILSPDTITIQAPTVTVQGNLQVNGAVTATGDVAGNGTSLHAHHHSGVQTGGGVSGGPV